MQLKKKERFLPFYIIKQHMWIVALPFEFCTYSRKRTIWTITPVFLNHMPSLKYNILDIR